MQERGDHTGSCRHARRRHQQVRVCTWRESGYQNPVLPERPSALRLLLDARGKLNCNLKLSQNLSCYYKKYNIYFLSVAPMKNYHKMHNQDFTCERKLTLPVNINIKTEMNTPF